MQRNCSFITRVISLMLVICMLFLSSCVSEKQNVVKTPDFLEQEDEVAKALREEMGMEVLQNEDSTISYVVDGEYGKFELKYDDDTGEIFYIDDDGEYLLEITDVNTDGIASWKVEKENEILEGEVNTSEAATPQMLLTIAGTTVAVSNAVYYAIMAAGTLMIARETYFLASRVAPLLKAKRTYDYYPAYFVGRKVYVHIARGISFTQAVIRIRMGLNVWANSKSMAYSACVNASPIYRAEWGNHGSIANGYYPHYHAVRYYTSNKKYVHTGSHCWYY